MQKCKDNMEWIFKFSVKHRQPLDMYNLSSTSTSLFYFEAYFTCRNTPHFLFISSHCSNFKRHIIVAMFNFSVCLKITPWNFLFIFKNRFGKIPAQARGLRCWVGQSVTKKAWFCIIWTIDYVNVQLCAKESMCTSDNEILYKFPKLQGSLCCILHKSL